MLMLFPKLHLNIIVVTVYSAVANNCARVLIIFFVLTIVGLLANMKIIPFILLKFVVAISLANCQPSSDLLQALEEALINNNTDNLIKLQTLFYPSQSIPADTVYVSIFLGNIRVERIQEDCDDCNGAFVCDEIQNGVLLDCSLNHSDFDSFTFSLSQDSDANSHARLLDYLRSPSVLPYMTMMEYVSFYLFNALTFTQLTESTSSEQYITLLVNELQMMPSIEDFEDAMMSLLSWAKYYARSNGVITMYERRDTDKRLVAMSLNNYDIDGYADDTANILLLYCLHLAIAIVGIYSIPKLLQRIILYLEKNPNSIITTKELDEIYWATVFVCAAINILCTVVSLYYSCTSADDESEEYLYYPLPLMLVFGPIEMISILLLVVITNNLKIRDSILCCSNRFVLSFIHTFAICQILWFLHLVGRSLVVAIFFIALAPAQTLAVISLMYVIILCTILYVAYNIHNIKIIMSATKGNSDSYKAIISGKLFLLFLLYLCIIGVMACLTIIFNKLAKHGLTSTGLGSVILSLVAPTIVFVITLQLKHHFEKYFKKDQPNSSDEVQILRAGAVGETTPLLINT